MKVQLMAKGALTTTFLLLLVSITIVFHTASWGAGPLRGDNRRTEGEYAADRGLPIERIAALYAATGRLTCAKAAGTAQVTHRRDIITTAAHIFFDDDCNLNSDPNGCRFETKVDGVSFQSNVTLFRKGDWCNNTRSTKTKSWYLTVGDWAVMRLESPLPQQVQPYKIGEFVQPKETVTFASSGSSDFMVKHLGDCRILNVVALDGVPYSVSSNCDYGPGSSGGALLRRDNFEIVAIAVGLAPNIRKHIEIPIVGEFLGAVLENEFAFELQSNSEGGVLVTNVLSVSLLRAQIRPGDTILRIGKTMVSTPQEVLEALAKARVGETMEIREADNFIKRPLITSNLVESARGALMQ